MRSLEVGGGIDPLGSRASSPASLLAETYVLDDGASSGALYLDNGSNDWQVRQNVVRQTSTNWVFLQTWSTRAIRNTVTGNWSDTAAISSYDDSNLVTANQTGLTTFSPSQRPSWPPPGRGPRRRPRNG
jgi:hypothetical protein